MERLQKQVQEDMDREFKMFLKYRGIEIDPADFEIGFNRPMNFTNYRTLQLDTERATLFNQVQAIPYMSNQFKLKKYLGLSEEEVKENETLWRQENEYAKFIDSSKAADLRNLGVRPDNETAVDPDAELPEQDVAGLEGAPDAELGLNTSVPGGPPGPPEEQV